ncbi:hypothetical protein CRG98_043563 [Punica granatum]|uniref:Uncharacterized protein n=1 Tax=Punica granatum TaxID=22663 RepID=A0A2I0HWF4_PUNGR|nr:hypothetical protein CRG98_043563 [Punica granatum]
MSINVALDPTFNPASLVEPNVLMNCWPELYGTSGEKALAVIKRENPMVQAFIVKKGTAVILNYCCDRVWVWVDDSGVVDRVPTIG